MSPNIDEDVFLENQKFLNKYSYRKKVPTPLSANNEQQQHLI